MKCLPVLDRTVKAVSSSRAKLRTYSLDDMHAGERLKSLIEESRHTKDEFAAAVARSRAQVYNWFKEERFTLELYETIAPVLTEWGMDPAPLNPRSEITVDSPSELRALLDGIPAVCLENVRTMILAGYATKIGLLALIEEKLANRK